MCQPDLLSHSIYELKPWNAYIYNPFNVDITLSSFLHQRDILSFSPVYHQYWDSAIKKIKLFTTIADLGEVTWLEPLFIFVVCNCNIAVPLTPASNASHISDWGKPFAMRTWLWFGATLLPKGWLCPWELSVAASPPAEICAAPQGARRPRWLYPANQFWVSWVWWGRDGWIINAFSSYPIIFTREWFLQLA